MVYIFTHTVKGGSSFEGTIYSNEIPFHVTKTVDPCYLTPCNQKKECIITNAHVLPQSLAECSKRTIIEHFYTMFLWNSPCQPWKYYLKTNTVGLGLPNTLYQYLNALPDFSWASSISTFSFTTCCPGLSERIDIHGTVNNQLNITTVHASEETHQAQQFMIICSIS